jgi:protein O-GlcNAc transferase
MESVDEIFSQALSAHRIGDVENAEILYRQVLGENADNAAAQSNLGTLLAAQGNYAEAELLFRSVLEHLPDDVDVQTNLGNILQNQGRLEEARPLYINVLKIQPGHSVAEGNLANLYLGTGELEKAIEVYQGITARGAKHSWIFSNYAAALNALDRREEALAQAKTALELDENNADAHNNTGSALLALNKSTQAVTSFRRASEIRPDWPTAQLNLGAALERIGEVSEALGCYRRAWDMSSGDLEIGRALVSLMISEDHLTEAGMILEALDNVHSDDSELPFHRANLARSLGNLEQSVQFFRQAIGRGLEACEAYNNLATSLFELERIAEAYEEAKKAVELNPDFAHGYNTMGNCLAENGDLENAKAHYLKAWELEPSFSAAISNAAGIARRQGKLDEAINIYTKALEADPGLTAAWNGIGLVYQNDNRIEEALAAYEKGLKINPDDWELMNNKAISLQAKGQIKEAMELYNIALKVKPDSPDIYYNLGNLLQYMQKFDESVAAFNAVLQLRPDFNSVYSFLAHSLMQQCNWINLETAIERIVQNIANEISAGKRITTSPFSMLSLPVPAEHRLLGARQLSDRMADALNFQRENLDISYKPKGEKLRIGYVSPDFRRHSLGLAFLDLLNAHDRSKFEIFGYGLVRGSEDEVTDHFKASFDHYEDITLNSYEDAARMIVDDGINILVDIAGHTRGARLEIFSLLPAPVQVHYLGYGHTIGADFIPWLITDHAAIPESMAPYCSEKLVYLPDSFLTTTRHEISDETFERAQFGLPEDAFVLANFNGPYKIDPETFAVWMRLLRKVPDAVLWLRAGTEGSERNLRREAKSRGVDPDRLVFAGIIPHAKHLSRLKLADLALDGYYHSGGVTTTDALWAGLPVLTVAGPTPSAQTGVSALSAAHLPELVTYSLGEYEKKLHYYANNRDDLRAVREKLAATRDDVPLFDSDRQARHLETAYEMMWQRYEDGQEPESFDVPSID